MEKVLAVDDDRLFLDALRRGLKKYESLFQTFYADSVDAAVKLMKKERISVLVTDIVMPGKGGIDLFAYKDRFHPRVQCIVMTGYGTAELRDSAQVDDAFCYLEKPFEISELTRSIMHAIWARDEGQLINPVLLSTLLKLISARKETCVLDVAHVGGGKGNLYFIDGTLVGAECGNTEGDAAAEAMLAWQRVHFNYQTFPAEMIRSRVKTGLSIQSGGSVQPAMATVAGFGDPGEALKDGAPSRKPLRLLIVDDSRIMRKAIAATFNGKEDFIIVGECENGVEALETIQQTPVDVITLDVEMPLMDGLTMLKHLMIRHPVPVVMVSSLTQEGTSVTFDALKLGAVDFVAKPSRLTALDMERQSAEIIRKIRLAADVENSSIHYIRSGRKAPVKKNTLPGESTSPSRLFAIGAAEGGYGGLLKILPRLPNDFSGACLVMLHAATAYVDAFVQYLDEYCLINVKRAVAGARVEIGSCYIASEEEYMTIEATNNRMLLQVNPAPMFHTRSNINIMMFSVAEMRPEETTGIILSGSGMDGCEGMAEIKRVGGDTIVQSPENCTYKQMAEAVIHHLNVSQVIPETKIADEIIRSAV